MEVLWRHPGDDMSGREVADELHEYAYTTIATVLDRLSRKGEVQRRHSGRRIRFSAARTGASHAAQAMREALGTSADLEASLADFVDSLPEQQRALLRRTLGD
jgi:predicted transcriptional regulator